MKMIIITTEYKKAIASVIKYLDYSANEKRVFNQRSRIMYKEKIKLSPVSGKIIFLNSEQLIIKSFFIKKRSSYEHDILLFVNYYLLKNRKIQDSLLSFDDYYYATPIVINLRNFIFKLKA